MSESAFPHPTEGTYADQAKGLGWIPQTGMTLRDYFAGQAMAGLASLDDDRFCPEDEKETLEEWRRGIFLEDASTAYSIADAMLEARKEGV